MKVLLVCMPFVSVERPVLGVSALKARLLQAGVACDVAYLSLAFARTTGRSETPARSVRRTRGSRAARPYPPPGDSFTSGTRAVSSGAERR